LSATHRGSQALDLLLDDTVEYVVRHPRHGLISLRRRTPFSSGYLADQGPSAGLTRENRPGWTGTLEEHLLEVLDTGSAIELASSELWSFDAPDLVRTLGDILIEDEEATCWECRRTASITPAVGGDYPMCAPHLRRLLTLHEQLQAAELTVVSDLTLDADSTRAAVERRASEAGVPTLASRLGALVAEECLAELGEVWPRRGELSEAVSGGLLAPELAEQVQRFGAHFQVDVQFEDERLAVRCSFPAQHHPEWAWSVTGDKGLEYAEELGGFVLDRLAGIGEAIAVWYRQLHARRLCEVGLDELVLDTIELLELDEELQGPVERLRERYERYCELYHGDLVAAAALLSELEDLLDAA
jgi:hypothetical protein